MYGKGVDWTAWTCQKWFVKFCAGDFSLNGASQSGGPVEVDSDQTEMLIEVNILPCWQTQNIKINEVID